MFDSLFYNYLVFSINCLAVELILTVSFALKPQGNFFNAGVSICLMLAFRCLFPMKLFIIWIEGFLKTNELILQKRL